jgi:hypothetical protein
MISLFGHSHFVRYVFVNGIDRLDLINVKKYTQTAAARHGIALLVFLYTFLLLLPRSGRQTRNHATRIYELLI